MANNRAHPEYAELPPKEYAAAVDRKLHKILSLKRQIKKSQEKTKRLEAELEALRPAQKDPSV